jgi:hypothetical protein
MVQWHKKYWKKEPTSRLQVATDNETITVPNNKKHYNIKFKGQQRYIGDTHSLSDCQE